MSLMKRIAAICNESPEGISTTELHKCCPEWTRKQIIAAAQNCYTSGLVSRIKKSGYSAASHTDPAIYGPKADGQQALESVTRKNTYKPKLPLNQTRPVNSVWELAKL